METTVKRLAIVERGKGERNFSCFAVENVDNCRLIGYGSTARAAMEDIRLGAKELQEDAAKEGRSVPDVEFEYLLDIGSFFDYYPLNITAAARYLGINASVLRLYATAQRQPRQAQLDRIREGLSRLVADMASARLVEKPPVDYVA